MKNSYYVSKLNKKDKQLYINNDSVEKTFDKA